MLLVRYQMLSGSILDQNVYEKFRLNLTDGSHVFQTGQNKKWWLYPYLIMPQVCPHNLELSPLKSCCQGAHDSKFYYNILYLFWSRQGLGILDLVKAQYNYHFGRFGIVYHGSTDNKLRVTFNGKIRYFTLHQVLEFDSDRKCMSVIIETDKGKSKVDIMFGLVADNVLILTNERSKTSCLETTN